MAVKQKTQEEKLAARGEELMARLTNKHKREVVRHFDCAFDELDSFDQMVMLATLADQNLSLEDADAMPFGDLQKVVIGE